MALFAQIAAFFCALLTLGKGIGMLRAPGRRRVGAALTTIALVFVLVTSMFLFLAVRGSPTSSAPGHDLRYGGGQLLSSELTPGALGAPSYERTLYGTTESAVAVARSLEPKLAALGYARVPPTAGPSFRPNEPSASGQFAHERFRFRIYELAQPTRFAGVSYSGREFPHLVAIVLSDDGA